MGIAPCHPKGELRPGWLLIEKNSYLDEEFMIGKLQLGNSIGFLVLFNLRNSFCKLPVVCCLLFIAHCLLPACLFAQNDTIRKQKIAIFAPLYLDSAFDAEGNYRYEKNFPKFINPGLEFYEGVQLAIDSMNKEKLPLEVFVFDTRSAQPLQQLVDALDSSVGLIIAHASMQENWVLAYAAQVRRIPYINVNLPNDGGINGNPYFIMLNPSLKTHVEGVYRFLQKYFLTNTVLVLGKKGPMEDVIKNYIGDYSRTTASVPLKMKYVDLTDSFTVKELAPLLDSNRQNVCLAASLDDHFNRRLITQIATFGKQYSTSIIGMPTLDNLEKDFGKHEFRGPEIIYGHPFYNAKNDTVSRGIIHYFNTKMYARPSDMVFRGYEVFWKYARLLLKHRSELASNLHDRNNKVFTDFDVQPMLNRQTMTMEYFENRKLYFLRWQDGVLKAVN